MLVRLVLIFTLTVVPFLVLSSGTPALAQTCSVKKVINLVHREKTRTEIRRICKKVDVKKCSLTQVVRMAKKGETARDIYGKCKRS